MKRELKTLKKNLFFSEKQLNELQNQVYDLEKMISKLRRRLPRSARSSANKDENLQEQIAIKKNHLKCLKRELKTLQKESRPKDKLSGIKNQIIDLEKDLSKLKQQLPRSLRRIYTPKKTYTKSKPILPQTPPIKIIPKTPDEEYQVIEENCLERSLTNIDESIALTPREDNFFINTPLIRQFQ